MKKFIISLLWIFAFLGFSFSVKANDLCFIQSWSFQYEADNEEYWYYVKISSESYIIWSFISWTFDCGIDFPSEILIRDTVDYQDQRVFVNDTFWSFSFFQPTTATLKFNVYWSDQCVFNYDVFETSTCSVWWLTWITVLYWNDSFFSTWKVYITWWNFVRNGQTISYDWLTGVNLHRVSALNWWTWVDHYELTDIYLSWAYNKNYTWWASNFWLMDPVCDYKQPWWEFLWYVVSWWTDLEFTENQNFSWNVFEGFYTQGMRFVVSNYPTILMVMFWVLLVLLIYRILFRRRF